jgi:hypothetical protein
MEKDKNNQEKNKTLPKTQPARPDDLETKLGESKGSYLDMFIAPQKYANASKQELLVQIRPLYVPKSDLYWDSKERHGYLFRDLGPEELDEIFSDSVKLLEFSKYLAERNCFSYVFDANLKKEVYFILKNLNEENNPK